ncbi:unnamed protein product [Penicillium olsonii]|nr:unnamed protein product [Penicillium olsonii]
MSEESSKGCIACGWTLDQQEKCSYSSHVKLFYGASRRGVWSIGSDVILKERPDEGPKSEVITLNHLASYSNIPVPKILRDWVDSNGRYFVLQERIQGQTLEKAWSSLSKSQKVGLADEVIGIRKQLRSLRSTSIQNVDQSPCFPGLLFFDLEPHGPFHSDNELWDAISLTLHDPPTRSFPQRALDNLKKRLPKCEPYVLTHCDLNLGNIMVKDGELAGILDWEFAAYYPVCMNMSRPLGGGQRRTPSGKAFCESVWVYMAKDMMMRRNSGLICVICENTRIWMKRAERFWTGCLRINERFCPN